MQGERVRGSFERTNGEGEVVSKIDFEMEEREFEKIMGNLVGQFEGLLFPQNDITQTTVSTSEGPSRRDVLRSIDSDDPFVQPTQPDTDFDVSENAQDVEVRDWTNDPDQDQ